MDAVLVALLLVLIWAAVLMPPGSRPSARRRDAFVASLRAGADTDTNAAPEPPLTPKARRRQILGGLLVAIAATLLLGLLPTFRLLLVVHLLLVDSCLAYVALLVHLRDREAGLPGRAARPASAAPPAAPWADLGLTG